MRKLLLLFAAIVFFTTYVKGQLVYHDAPPYQDEKTLRHVSEKALEVIDSIIHYGLNTRRADIFEIKNEQYLLVDGTFDVFHWESGRWHNLYEGIFYGYNFGSKKFIIDDKIYSFGGYGYWNKHGQIIQFLKDRGSWELVDMDQIPPYGIACSKNRDLTVFSSDSIFYVNIDRKTMVARPLIRKMVEKSDLPNRYTIELKNYTLIYGRNPFYLIEKKNDSIFESNLSPFKGILNALKNGMIYVKGDSMFCYDRSFKLEGAYDAQSERDFFKPIKVVNNSILGGFSKWLIVLAAGLLIAFIIYFATRKKHKPFLEEGILSEAELDLEHPLIIKLQNFNGVGLSQDQLDEIFEINHILSPESKRFRRSQQIKEINQLYRISQQMDMITRVKDPTDKRKFIYQIQS